MAQPVWQFKKDGGLAGPFTDEEIRALYDLRFIKDQTPVVRAGDPRGWQMLEEEYLGELPAFSPPDVHLRMCRKFNIPLTEDLRRWNNQSQPAQSTPPAPRSRPSARLTSSAATQTTSPASRPVGNVPRTSASPASTPVGNVHQVNTGGTNDPAPQRSSSATGWVVLFAVIIVAVLVINHFRQPGGGGQPPPSGPPKADFADSRREVLNLAMSAGADWKVLAEYDKLLRAFPKNMAQALPDITNYTKSFGPQLPQGAPNLLECTNSLELAATSGDFSALRLLVREYGIQGMALDRDRCSRRLNAAVAARLQQTQRAVLTNTSLLAGLKLYADCFADVPETEASGLADICPLLSRLSQAEIPPNRLPEVKPLLETSGGAGCAMAFRIMANIVLPSNPSGAESYYFKAAGLGDDFSMYQLGELKSQRDKNEAVEWWNQAATRGNADAKYALARLLLSKEPLPFVNNSERAPRGVALLKELAAWDTEGLTPDGVQIHVASLAFLGHIYLDGDFGLQRDAKTAVDLLSKAEQQNSRLNKPIDNLFLLLGLAYTGLNCPDCPAIDEARGVDYLKKGFELTASSVPVRKKCAEALVIYYKQRSRDPGAAIEATNWDTRWRQLSP